MNEDFADFFALLNQHGVEFLIIGGVAYNFHAPPRATKDIDVWVRPTRSNLERLVAALDAFGLPTEAIEIDELSRSTQVLTCSRDLTAWSGRSLGRVASCPTTDLLRSACLPSKI